MAPFLGLIQSHSGPISRSIELFADPKHTVGLFKLAHSARKALMGSTLDACAAGTQAAMSTTLDRMGVAGIRAAESHGLTPNSNAERRRAIPKEVAIPVQCLPFPGLAQAGHSTLIRRARISQWSRRVGKDETMDVGRVLANLIHQQCLRHELGTKDRIQRA